jgi:DNA-binding Lrp family transcriptional regulator
MSINKTAKGILEGLQQNSKKVNKDTSKEVKKSERIKRSYKLKKSQISKLYQLKAIYPEKDLEEIVGEAIDFYFNSNT